MWSRTGGHVPDSGSVCHRFGPDTETKQGSNLSPCLPCYLVSFPHIPRGFGHKCCAICHLFWDACHVGGNKLVYACRRLDFTSCGLISQKSMRSTY